MAQRAILALIVLFSSVAVTLSPAHAGKREKAERLVGNASETASYFASDSAFETMWELADEAKAMVIVPNSIRAGFIFGGSAGDAVMIAKGDDGTWSQPVFMTVGSFSVGLQAGGESSEIILLVMTNRGMEQLLSTSVKLGADVTLAAGPIGAGGKAQTTDILAFSRSRGLYGGVSLEGAVLKIRHKYNEAYYGSPVSPADIVYREKVYNPSSAKVQNAADVLSRRNSITTFAPVVPVEADGSVNAGAPASQPHQSGTQHRPKDDGVYEDDEAWGAPIKSSKDQ